MPGRPCGESSSGQGDGDQEGRARTMRGCDSCISWSGGRRSGGLRWITSHKLKRQTGSICVVLNLLALARGCAIRRQPFFN